MSGLLFLSDDYFKIVSTPKGDILGTNIRGVSLILFYSTQCQYCDKFIPVFKKLPGTIGGCQFGMINISNNRSVVEKSKNTIMPLSVVPYIVIYMNGKPVMSYDGPATDTDIKNFVMTVVNNLNTKQQFINNDKEEEATVVEDNPIPAYTIGKPKAADKCYVAWDSAYKN